MKLAKNQALVDSYLALLPPAVVTSKAVPIIGGQATAEAISKLSETVKG